MTFLRSSGHSATLHWASFSESIQIRKRFGSFSTSPTHLAKPSMRALTQKDFVFNIKAFIISPSCFAFLARPLGYGRPISQRHFAPFQCIELIGGCRVSSGWASSYRHVQSPFRSLGSAEAGPMGE